jgi:TPP-dependent pyruvate/acetoin dehydrogenase alpha subunit
MDFTTLEDELFYKCLRIRLVEERIIALYPSDRIQSPVHLSIGQEAVAVGTCHGLRDTDPLFPTYRSHAFFLAKGGDMGRMFAELYGKDTGAANGKAGSMHLLAPEVGLMPASAVVASTIPCGVGAALAAKRRGLDQVVVTTFGDGATEEGVYHESLNLAALFTGPLILLCENNGLAVHASLSDRQSYGILDHAAQYGIPITHITAGYDPAAVAEAFTPVVERVRRDRTPHFVMIDTYRYKEHVGPGDDFDAGYRSLSELERWQANDPLIRDTGRAARFRPAILAEIEAAVAFAEDSPWPGWDRLLEHVI